MKTEDSGKTWKTMLVGDTSLRTDYRDIQVLDTKTAIVMGITTPAIIYKTIDGGESWKKVYSNSDTTLFLDAMDFWDKKHGVILGDPVNGNWTMLRTTDGGESWSLMRRSRTPDSQFQEAAFAAGGTAMRAFGDEELAFVTGGSEGSRILFSHDRGMKWKYLFPLVKGSKSSGLFSFDKNSKGEYVMVGGDYLAPMDSSANLAIVGTGKIYQVTQVPDHVPGGYRCAVASAGYGLMIATGDEGTDISTDDGFSWNKLSNEGFFAVACKGNTCVLSGKKGKIGLIRFGPGQ